VLPRDKAHSRRKVASFAAKGQHEPADSTLATGRPIQHQRYDVSGVGTFAGIWLLEGTQPNLGKYLVVDDHRFFQLSADVRQAARFVLYEASEGRVQLQVQHSNQHDWMPDAEGCLGGPIAVDIPYTFTSSIEGAPPTLTIQFLCEFHGSPAHMSISGVAGSLLWLHWAWDDVEPPFPLIAHMVAPSLFDIQNSMQASGTDFTNVILEGADLSGVDLTKSVFTGASLERVSFAGATLTGATLTGQDLRVCELTGAHLHNAILQNVKLQGAVLDPLIDLSGADLRGARLSGATLAAVNLSGADLRNAQMDNANLAGANLSGSDLRNAEMNNADLSGADLSGTNFSGLDLRRTAFGSKPTFSTDPRHLTDFSHATLPFSVIGLNWSYLNLEGTKIVSLPVDSAGHYSLPGLRAVAANLSAWDFSGADLRRGDDVATFSGAILIGANFSGSDCTGAMFDGATLGGGGEQTPATMAEATLFDVSFRDAQLSGVNFSGAMLWGSSATVSGATMTGVDMSNAYLTDLDLSNVEGANMAGVVFDGACLVNCNFTGTKVVRDQTGRGGSFVRACLQGADFTDASLEGATLADAGVALAPCPTPGGWKFTATLKIRGKPQTISIVVKEAGTLLPASVTDTGTVCPNHEHGPCTGAQLVSPTAPTSWSQL
jgi:uncharacterized protein YjbI with pentapeptide repeats